MSITPTDIFQAFAAQGQPPRWILRDDRQDAWLVQARAAVAIVMHDVAGMSWPAVGDALNRSHTTVMRAVDTHRTDPDVIEMAGDLCKSLGRENQIRTSVGGAA